MYWFSVDVHYNQLLLQFAAYLKKKNASGQQVGQKKKKIENDTESSKEISVGGESLDSSPLASSLEDSEGIKLVSYIYWYVSLFNITFSPA